MYTKTYIICPNCGYEQNEEAWDRCINCGYEFHRNHKKQENMIMTSMKQPDNVTTLQVIHIEVILMRLNQKILLWALFYQ